MTSIYTESICEAGMNNIRLHLLLVLITILGRSLMREGVGSVGNGYSDKAGN